MPFVFPPRRKLQAPQQQDELWRLKMFTTIEAVIETIEALLYPATTDQQDKTYN